MGFFLFAVSSRLTLRPAQPSTQCEPGSLTPQVKRPWRETGHLSPSSDDVKNAIPPPPNMSS